MTPETVIEASDLALSFRGKGAVVKAIDGIDIALRAGSVTLLMGPSGSGKSSLLSVLSGLSKPDTGVVDAMGATISSMSAGARTRFRRRYCGFVFQTVGLFPSLNAMQQVTVSLDMLGITGREARARAREGLERVGLGDRLDHHPMQMSGGENQRVAIARMLAKQPRLIFCDEPTSALDSKSGERVAELLRHAAKSENAMVFCVTHDPRLERFADRIVEISDGQLVGERVQ